MAGQKPISSDLWRNRSFLFFWTGRAISLLGTGITSIVLPILVYRLTSSALLTSLLATLEVLPYLLFGVFAGDVADRANRRWLMVSCDILNAFLLGGIPVAGWFHVLTVSQIFVVALLSASVFVWFDAAEFGTIPSLVGRKHLVSATSAITSMSTIVGIVGPALGGALIATIGLTPALNVDASSYVLSAISLLLIPRAFSTVQKSEHGVQLQHYQTLANIREGVHFLWHHRLVRVPDVARFWSKLYRRCSGRFARCLCGTSFTSSIQRCPDRIALYCGCDRLLSCECPPSPIHKAVSSWMDHTHWNEFQFSFTPAPSLDFFVEYSSSIVRLLGTLVHVGYDKWKSLASTRDS